jgi:hypothetical protein
MPGSLDRSMNKRKPDRKEAAKAKRKKSWKRAKLVGGPRVEDFLAEESKKKVFEPKRWTLAEAGSEFGLSPKTIAQRVKAEGALPGEDGKFSTMEIHAAICGDYERQRTRKTKEDADRSARENAVGRSELVDKGDFLQRYEQIHAGMVQKVNGSTMTATEKDALLADIEQLHSL